MDLTYRFRDCSCPGTPHPDGDTVTFPAKLDFLDYSRALGLIFSGDTPLAQNAFSIYLHAPIAWNVLDDDQEPVPLTPEALDDLPFADQYEIAAHGDTLYSVTVLSPLVRRTTAPSETGPTSGSSTRRSKH